MLTVEFADAFQPRYQRNNKRSGQKNLRCFPTCNETGHMASGFCGRPVVCFVRGVQLPDPSYRIRAFGEFVECGSDDQLRPGARVKLSEAVAKTRSRENPILPWLNGEITLPANDTHVVQVVFNRKLLGWHYSWLSTKHTCNSFHCFRALLFFQPPESEDLVFVGTVRSPKFQLHSRRRLVATESTGDAASGELSPSSGPAAGARKRKQEPGGRSPKNSRGAPEFTAEGGLMPQYALASAVIDSEGVDEVLQAKTREMDENRCVDRLVQFILHFAEGMDANLGAQPPHMIPQAHDYVGHQQRPPQIGQPLESTPYSEQRLQDVLEAELFGAFGSGLASNDMSKLLPQPRSPSASSHVSNSSSQLSLEGQSPGIQQLRVVLRRFADKTEPEIDLIVRRINELSENVMRLSRNNSSFEAIFKKYSTPAGLIKLKEQIARERSHTSFAWTREREDETYDPDTPENNTENSFFAEVRHQLRVLLHSSLNACQQTVGMYMDIMELAAKHNVLTNDSYYPPNERVAVFVHIQLHGNLNKFTEQDYGCRRRQFESVKQQQEYARDLLIVKRGIFRRQLCNRLVQEQKNKRILMGQDQPVPNAWDINGSWLSLDSAGETDSSKMSGLIKVLRAMGLPFGTFFGKLFESMFSKLDIKVTRNVLVLKGQQVLLANPEMVVPLGGKPQPFRGDAPLPVAPLMVEKVCVGWLDIADDGSHLIYVVVGGDKLPIEFSHLFKIDADDNIEFEHAEDEDPLRRSIVNYVLSHGGRDARPEMRTVQCFVIPPVAGEKESFELVQSFYLYAKGEMAPKMDNLQGLKHMASGKANCMQMMSFTTRFVRNYLNSTDTEYILDLL